MPVMVKSLTALILYCVFFSIAILFLSPLYFTERRNVSTYDSDSVNLLSINKASVARELLERQAELEIQDKTDEKSPPRYVSAVLKKNMVQWYYWYKLQAI